MKNIIPVIICGGSGSRLWPLSRQSFPKQFWPLISDSNYSLLQHTLLRIKDISKLGNPLIITNERYRFLVVEQMKEINIKNFEIILEPEGRNTGPAIALATLYSIIKEKEDSNLIFFSADHFIHDKKGFELTLINSFKNINEQNIYTFGVIPNKPETGYGYIKISNLEKIKLSSSNKIDKFIEKPSFEDAKKYLKSGNYLWNSGIFLLNSKTLLNELNKFAPKILQFCQKSLKNYEKDNYFIRPDKEFFLECPNISIDIAVLEKSSSVFVIPLDVGWSDIGDWSKLWENSIKDENFNSVKGNVFLEKCSNSYFYSQNKLLVGVGVNNLTVIDSDDAVLIIDKNNTNLLKEVVQSLKNKGLKESYSHNKEYRPWGSYKTINSGERWRVKEIIVKPNEKLSLQSHFHRSEHWIVVKGTALVEINGTEKLVKENESIYIPLGSKHRLSNPGKINVNLIEVQTGSYLEENDIVRYKDIYGRKKL